MATMPNLPQQTLAEPLASPQAAASSACGSTAGSGIGQACVASRIDLLDGRRIYIHKLSFRELIAQGSDHGARMCEALAFVRATKMIHHQAEMAVELGLMRRAMGEELVGLFGWSAATDVFKDLVFRPCFPKQASIARRLLEPGERIVASCYEAGYYTFATGAAASGRMFADHETAGDAQRALNAGVGPSDLTMLRGRCLTGHSTDAGTGDVGHLYSHALRRSVLDESAIDEIDRSARAACLARVTMELALRDGALSDTERRVGRDIEACLESSFVTVASV
jgi:hypothetical protein